MIPHPRFSTPNHQPAKLIHGQRKNCFRRQQDNQRRRSKTRRLQVYRSAGAWQHFTTTLTETTKIFSPRAWGSTAQVPRLASDQRHRHARIPDSSSAWIDIFNAEPTLSLICTIVEPITREPYNRDPRGIAEKAEVYLKAPASPTRLPSDPRPSSSSLMRCAVVIPRIHPFIWSTAQKGIGTARAKNSRISVIRFVQRKVISRSQQSHRRFPLLKRRIVRSDHRLEESSHLYPDSNPVFAAPHANRHRWTSQSG